MECEFHIKDGYQVICCEFEDNFELRRLQEFSANPHLTETLFVDVPLVKNPFFIIRKEI